MKRSTWRRPPHSTLTDEQRAVLNQIELLSPESFNDQSAFSINLNAMIKDKQDTLRFKQRQQARAKQERRKQQEQAWEPLMVNWCKDNLSVGDIVKMRGCRDGHGLREILELDYNAKYGAIHCNQLRVNRWRRGASYVDLKDDGRPYTIGVTDHMWNKVTHIVNVSDDGQAFLTPIKEIVKGLTEE